MLLPKLASGNRRAIGQWVGIEILVALRELALAWDSAPWDWLMVHHGTRCYGRRLSMHSCRSGSI